MNQKKQKNIWPIVAVIVSMIATVILLAGLKPSRSLESFASNDRPAQVKKSQRNSQESGQEWLHDQSISLQPTPPPAESSPAGSIAEAKEALYRGDLDAALAVLHESLERAPKDDQVLTLLTEAYLEKKDFGSAYKYLLDALDANPSNQQAILALPEVLVHPIPKHPQAKTLAYEFLKEEQAKEAKPVLDLAMAQLEKQDRNYTAALDRLDRISQNPEYTVRASNEAAQVYARQGKYDQAKAFYEGRIANVTSTSQTLPKDWQELRLNYALMLVDLKEYDAARQQLSRLDAEVENADTGWLLARIDGETAK